MRCFAGECDLFPTLLKSFSKITFALYKITMMRNDSCRKIISEMSNRLLKVKKKKKKTQQKSEFHNLGYLK